jgi:putative salt-induced outer membrane protein YdiY
MTQTIPTKPSVRRRAWCLAAALLLAGTPLLAQDPDATIAPAPPANTNHWETTAAAALTLTRGNSENFLVTLSLDTKRKWEKNNVALGVSGGYGDSTVNNVNTKNTEFLQGYGQYNYNVTPRFYAGLRGDGQYDGIAGVEYRFKVTPLVGYQFIKTKKILLSGEVGPSMVWEHLDGSGATSYAAIRFAESFEYKLTESTKLWQGCSYIPQITEWTENYLINFEAGIDTAITKHWNLRVVFQDMYASAPAPGKKDNDIRLLAGVSFKF